MDSELFIVCLVFLVLVLMILVTLCWILKRSRSRNLTELRVSAGKPVRILTIRTEPDQVKQLLDRLLDRVFLQVQTDPESEDEFQEEPRVERKPEENHGGERGSDSGSEPEASTSAFFSRRPVSIFQDNLWKWITAKVRPSHENEATPPPPPPPPPPSPSQDHTNDPSRQPWDASRHASSSQGRSCSESSEEDYQDGSQL